MAMKLMITDPAKAKAYFEAKMAFTRLRRKPWVPVLRSSLLRRVD